jgi:hypothetical protein
MTGSTSFGPACRVSFIVSRKENVSASFSELLPGGEAVEGLATETKNPKDRYSATMMKRFYWLYSGGEHHYETYCTYGARISFSLLLLTTCSSYGAG